MTSVICLINRFKNFSPLLPLLFKSSKLPKICAEREALQRFLNLAPNSMLDLLEVIVITILD